MTPTKAVSFSQPWLWSILHVPPPAGKRIENRPWKPAPAMIGQRIALHAAKSWDHDALLFFHKLGLAPPAKRDAFTASAIVGVATISAVLTMEDVDEGALEPRNQADQERWCFGDYCWVLSDVGELATPIPCGGSLGLWAIKPDSLEKLAAGMDTMRWADRSAA